MKKQLHKTFKWFIELLKDAANIGFHTIIIYGILYLIGNLIKSEELLSIGMRPIAIITCLNKLIKASIDFDSVKNNVNPQADEKENN